MIISIILKLAISYQIFKELILLQWFAVKIFPSILHKNPEMANGKRKHERNCRKNGVFQSIMKGFFLSSSLKEIFYHVFRTTLPKTFDGDDNEFFHAIFIETLPLCFLIASELFSNPLKKFLHSHSLQRKEAAQRLKAILKL